MKKLICLILSAVLAVGLLCSCDRNVYPLSSTQIMMDTVVTVTIYDGDDDVLTGAMQLCKKYENLLSKTLQGSDVYKITHANGQPVTVDDDTAELLRIALEIAQK